MGENVIDIGPDCRGVEDAAGQSEARRELYYFSNTGHFTLKM
jgi:hypothetical protein